ncbi:MAG: hypothetical protein IPM45_15170 [Acidimicrobiales bacterium]|nr:hypothetical protein [Acidimicrobiales bacterium]
MDAAVDAPPAPLGAAAPAEADRGGGADAPEELGTPPGTPPGTDGGGPPPGLVDRLVARARRVPVEGWITGAVVTACVVFTVLQLSPELLLANTTPAGGDMGAHVWGPAYLRDHLLPHGRVTGWTPDWYAGFPAYTFYMVVPSLVIVALDVLLPYGVAFKLVTVLGVLTLPVSAWAFGRLTRMRFPAPALLAVATVPFLFDRGFTIYGGNIPSTLAGEFAFSISLSLALLALGVVSRGLETGRYRAWAALLLALTALCHLIPAGFALAGSVVLVLMHPGKAQLRWALTVAPVAAALTAFWTLPFFYRHAYLNDMGWEKLTDYTDQLFRPDHYWLLGLAVVGALFAVATRQRSGVFLVLLAAVFGVAFVVMPQHRLWNARLLPFWYLLLYLLAGFGLAELGRALARGLAVEAGRSLRFVERATPIVGLLAMLAVVGFPLRVLPGGHEVVRQTADGTEQVYRWLFFETTDSSFVPGWANWNYSGYERKDAYPEYYGIVSTMAGIGEEQGCGRAMWEHANTLDRYGTPMALMLLPFWTDGCIGSMEGLYFESSATTPYHFLNQSELSQAPSRAMRDLPYGPLDVNLGVQHLQLLGVRYYLAFSPEAIEQARESPDLVEIGGSPPWVVFEVQDAPLVEALTCEPAVLTGLASTGGRAWLDVATDWYLDPSRWDVPLAQSGPAAWPRTTADEQPPCRPVGDAAVSDLTVGDDRISFRVDQVGVPILVKASYFPNWQVSGADGPYRVTPNLMVVVPTSEEVSLRYGWTPVDWLAGLLTLLGVAGLVLLARRPPVPVPEAPAEATAGPPPGPPPDPPHAGPPPGPPPAGPPPGAPPPE